MFNTIVWQLLTMCYSLTTQECREGESMWIMYCISNRAELPTFQDCTQNLTYMFSYNYLYTWFHNSDYKIDTKKCIPSSTT